MRYDIIYEAHKHEHDNKNHWSANVVSKRSLHLAPACHLTEAAEAAAVIGRAVEARRASQAPITVITYYNSSHTRVVLHAAAGGLDCCWAAGSWRGALWKSKEICV